MNEHSEEPDGFILYDDRPDPLDHRRASRARFAAANLPILLGVAVLAALLLWLSQPCMGVCPSVAAQQIGGAVQVFVIALYGLLHYQSTWLEKRCNDATKGHYAALWIFRIGIGLAVVSLILPVFVTPLVFGGLAQFVFGIVLPANPRPNLMGYPKPDSAALKTFAFLAYITAILMTFGILYWI